MRGVGLVSEDGVEGRAACAHGLTVPEVSALMQGRVTVGVSAMSLKPMAEPLCSRLVVKGIPGGLSASPTTSAEGNPSTTCGSFNPSDPLKTLIHGAWGTTR